VPEIVLFGRIIVITRLETRTKEFCVFCMIHKDPKDSELCLSRAKPLERVVEARSDTDVQIVRLTLIWGRKTNRTI